MASQQPELPWRQNDQVLFGGLLGFSTVSVLQAIGAPQMSLWLQASLYLFAGAIPLLALSFHRATHRREPPTRLSRALDLPGVLGSVVGFGFFLAHLDWGAALVFAAVCSLAFVVAITT